MDAPTNHPDRRAFLAALGLGVLPGLARPRAPGPRTHAVGAAATVPAGPPELEALVLGSVQDAGLPQVGCYHPRCERGRELHAAGQGRFVASLALTEPGADRYYLVDATPDITRQIDLIPHPGFRERAAARDPFDGIFLTHAHIGHYVGLALLGKEGMGIVDTPVYCTAAMADFLEGNAPWSLMVDEGRIVPTPLAPDRWHRIDEGLSVTPLRVPHRDELADTVAFVFRGARASLLYLPDINAWSLWDRDVREVVASVNTALLDGSFWSLDELPGRSIDEVPHPLVRTTMDRLQPLADRGGTRVVFTHLNNSNPLLDDDGPERAEVLRRGFEVAREGMSIPL